MNRGRLSPREYRLLSAYLDGELSAKEHARVAQRLASDRRWQAAYHQMATVKRGLATLPLPSAPRPFTLTSSQAEAARPWHQPRPTRVYRWASALATVLLLITVAGDLFGRHLPLAAAPPPPTTMQLDSAPAAEKDLGPTTVTPLPGQEDTHPLAAPPQPAERLTIAPSPTPFPPPAVASPLPLTAPPAPPSPPHWPWRLAEALLACIALSLGCLGWRRH